MMSKFTAAQAREIGLGAVGARAIDAIPHLMIDPPHHEAGMQRIPRGDLISMNDGAISDPSTNCRYRVCLGWEHLGQSPAPAFAHRHDNFPAAWLVLQEASIDPISAPIFWPSVAAKVGSVDLRCAPFTSDD